jgi:hypothetical protein
MGPTSGQCGFRGSGGLLGEVGEDDPEKEQIFRDLWEDETLR